MKKSLLFSFSLIGVIGFATALPLLALAVFGRWLDQHFGTGRDFLYSGLVLATIIIYFTVKQIAKDAIEKFDKLNK